MSKQPKNSDVSDEPEKTPSSPVSIEVADTPNTGGVSTVNLLDLMTGIDTSPLELIRLSESDTAIIPFTAESDPVDLHYCDEPDISGYVLCNGMDCILCRIGRKKDERLLLPVYQPTAGSIGILAISRLLRPHALLPQLAPHLQAEGPQVLIISRPQMTKFVVMAQPLPDNVNAGERQIQAFLDGKAAGTIQLSSVYQRLSNETLAMVPQIAKALEIRGLGRK